MKVLGIVDEFERRLIAFINKNYNSFTERDIETIFNDLKADISFQL